MKKLKLFIFTLLSVLTLGLFVVTGSKVEAADATVGNHSVIASDFYADDSAQGYTYTGTGKNDKKAPTNLTVDIFALQSGTNYFNAYATYKSTVTNNTGKTFDTELQIGGGRTITVSIGTSQKAEVTIYAYDTGSNKTIKIGDGSIIDVTNNEVKSYTGVLYSENNVIEFSGSNICILEIDVVVSNITKYTVTFEKNGANETVVNQLVVSGEKASDPGIITKQNSIFDGWYTKDGTNDDWGNEWNFDVNTVTSDITLYAKWSAGTVYTITFKVDTETYATKYVTDGENENKLLDWPSNPVKAGYEFDGWYYQDTVYGVDSIFNSNIELDASFSLSTIAIGTREEIKYTDESLIFTSNADTVVSGKFTFVESTNNKTAFTVADSAIKIGSSATLSNGIPTGNYIMINIPANSTAKISITGRSSNEGTTCTLGLKTKTTDELEIEFTTNKNEEKYCFIENNSSSITSVYFYRTGSNQVRINKISISVISYSTDINSTCAVSCVAEANSAKNTLRFIGTISGVTNIDDIKSIELVLLKDGVATNKQIFLTSCYSAVSNASTLHTANTNTFYVIFSLKGIDATVMPNNTVISKQIIVTFTDDTVAESETSEFVWKN